MNWKRKGNGREGEEKGGRKEGNCIGQMSKKGVRERGRVEWHSVLRWLAIPLLWTADRGYVKEKGGLALMEFFGQPDIPPQNSTL